METEVKSNEISLTRVYDAPLQAVWDAWTDPAKTAKWWGPRGFSLTTHRKDLRPGGHWRYTMHGPDGVDYENHTLYHVVEERSKLVYDHGASDDRPPLFRVTALFSEVHGKTKMELTMTLETAEAAEETRNFIKKAGGDATWDRLAEFLETEATGRETFVINRSFNGSLPVLYKVWTDPEHFSRWLPPMGFSMKFIRADIRPGGSTFYCMSGGDAKMYGRAHYMKLEMPTRVVYTQQFCDENEKVSRHPMVPTWPETMLTTVDLAEEGPNRTRVTITWEPYGACSREEIDTFVKGRPGMTQGWTGSLDKLDAYLTATFPSA